MHIICLLRAEGVEVAVRTRTRIAQEMTARRTLGTEELTAGKRGRRLDRLSSLCNARPTAGVTLDSGDQAAHSVQRPSHSVVSAVAIRADIPSRRSTHQPRPGTFSRRPIRRARLSTPPLPIDRPVRRRP